MREYFRNINTTGRVQAGLGGVKILPNSIQESEEVFYLRTSRRLGEQMRYGIFV